MRRRLNDRRKWRAFCNFWKWLAWYETQVSGKWS